MPVRFRLFLAMYSVLLAVIGLTVVANDRLDAGSGGADQVVSPGPDTGASADGNGAATVDRNDPPTYLEVSGLLTEVHLEGAVMAPRVVDTPLTVVSERGLGNGGELTGVSVNGKPSSIVWDGGRPFLLSSGPGLVLDPVEVDLIDGEIRCRLGGGAHSVGPGTYQLDTPVAVGGSGIATPRDAVAFVATRTSRFEAHGDAALVLAAGAPHTFTGPGLVHLEGDLRIDHAQGAQMVRTLDLRSGAFELTFAPTEGGGWTVSGQVDSEIVGDLVLGAPSGTGRHRAGSR